MVKEEIIERYGLSYYEELKNRAKLKQKLKYQSNKEYRDSQKSKTHGQMQSKYVKDGRIDLIENYELAKADNFKGWDIHHRDEIKVLPSGIKVIRTREDLMNNNRYYSCPPNELIWLTHKEHISIHHKLEC